MTVPVESRKYIKLDKVVYGQKYEDYSRVEGPAPLRRNVEYKVEIDNGGSSAVEFFTIQNDGTILPSKNAAAGENESIF